jgi:hypothetical protein
MNQPYWKRFLVALLLSMGSPVWADPVSFGFQLVPDESGSVGANGLISFSEIPEDGIYNFRSVNQFSATDLEGNAITNTMTRFNIVFGDRVTFPNEDVFRGSWIEVVIVGGYVTDIMGSSRYFDERPGMVYASLSLREGAYTVAGSNLNTGEDYAQHGSIVFDKVAAPVPEPSTFALLGLGMLAIGWQAGRRPKVPVVRLT